MPCVGCWLGMPAWGVKCLDVLFDPKLLIGQASLVEALVSSLEAP